MGSSILLLQESAMIKLGKRPREELESGVPAKRSQHAHHEGAQRVSTSVDNSEHSQSTRAHDDFEDPDEQMENAPEHSELVCYGALFKAKARASFIDRATIPALPWARFHAFQVTQRKNVYHLTRLDASIEDDFAQLDNITTIYLQALAGFKDISFSAIISSASLDKISGKKTKKSPIIDVTINVLGPEALAESVGDALGNIRGNLQHPVLLDTGTRYLNPQWFYPGNTMTDLSHLIGPKQEDAKRERLSQGIESVLHSLGGVTSQNSSEECSVTSMTECFLSNTRLKRHQIEGVKFILNREDSASAYNLNCEFLKLIDPRLEQPLSPCLGGVLADAMGLGKTLTMLSAIACSKPAAGENSASNKSKKGIPSFAKSTLVVLPSKQVMDVWDSEITRHFKQNTLEVGCFHGGGRAKTPKTLLKHDVVLTTYHTLAADWKGKKILQKIAWFRVTLDEAHCIRNQNTRFFKAAQHLQAERRWCLTGTPIQNSLQDLRSLTRFLQHAPLTDAKLFDKHIIDPMRTEFESAEQFRNLQLLLRVICLRRSEECINLPPSVTEEVSIVLSDQESAAYDKILSDCQKEFDRQVCIGANPRKSFILFATILKLRRLCNHGTIMQGDANQLFPALSGKLPRSGKLSDVTGDESCGFCNTEEEDSATLAGIDQCPQCGSWLNITATPSDQGYGTQLSPSPSGMSGQDPSSRTPTPSPLSTSFAIPGGPGYSSKLTAVAQNIESSCQTLNSKSVVFLSWRLTLDILGKTLSERGIKSVIIDGRVRPTDRTVILSTFREDPDVSALLMTIDSGAVGLTLTNANRVHIIEPHWNPAMEAQAIARVLRMGQSQTVTIVKYITENTVEKNIVKLQQKKSRIAKISLDNTADGDATGLLDDLKFVLDTT